MKYDNECCICGYMWSTDINDKECPRCGEYEIVKRTSNNEN